MLKKVSDIVAECLEAYGIEVVFGIIGSANSHIFNSIDKNTKIKIVCTHHEQAAVMAMGAYYRATGKLSAALVTAGGGSSNAFTGILSNWADSVPGLIISGQEQSYYVEQYSDMRMYGIQGYDSMDTYSKHVKVSARIDKHNVYFVLENALHSTVSNRPGPVFLEVPFDVQGQMVESRDIEVLGAFRDSSGVKQHARLIIDKLKKSKRPVILGGHGVKLSGAEKDFEKFVNEHSIPTLLSWSAVDLLHDENPNYFGRPGVQGQRAANFIIQNCDLLIVMGSRLSLLQTGYDRNTFAPNADIIHIDIDHTETRKFSGTNINCDVNIILKTLNDRTKEINVDASDWIDYCRKTKDSFPLVMPEHIKDPKNSYVFIDKFSEKLQDNYTIVTDMGTALLSGFYGFKLKRNQKMFTSLGLGEMGYGLAAAVGAGFGDKPVMCLNCDGGMMMNLQELQTIKNYNLPVKIVIFNNDGYLMIKHTQNMLFEGHKTAVDTATGVGLPDYEKVAQAFGYDYFREDKLDEFLSHPGQAILEVFMDPDQEFIPKVKGIKTQDNKIQSGLLEEMSPLLPLEVVKSQMIKLNEWSKKVKR
jgi:acetolactate synthase-1/2/3 large subunit